MRARLNAANTFGVFFIFAGAMHFVIPRTYKAMIPRSWPRRTEMVYASAAAEIAGGAGVLHPRTRKVASAWSVTTLLAVFPANIHMALNPGTFKVPGGRNALLARLPVQALFVLWARAAGRA